ADERHAVFVHAYDYPLDPARSGLVYRVGRPVVVRASGAVGVGALTGECEIRRDIDEPGQRRTGRIVEVVLLAVCAAQSSEVVRFAPRSPATPNENGVPAGGAVGVGVGVRVGVGVGVAVRVGVTVADRVGVAVADVDGVRVGEAVGPGVWLPPV